MLGLPPPPPTSPVRCRFPVQRPLLSRKLVRPQVFVVALLQRRKSALGNIQVFGDAPAENVVAKGQRRARVPEAVDRATDLAEGSKLHGQQPDLGA